MSPTFFARGCVIAAAVAFTAADGFAKDVVLFPYFQSNGESGVFLSYSTDGRNFQPANNGNAVFTPPAWPDGQNLTRDPSIVYNNGLFHMVWTSNWSGRVFGYANSPDLVSWSSPLQVTPFPVGLPSGDQPDNIWAPEIHYDQIQENYQIAFSSTTPNEEFDGDGSEDPHGNDHRLFSIRTTDFNSFTPASMMFDHNYSVIDGQMIFDDGDTPTSSDDRWIMAIKREQSELAGGKNIRFTFNDPQQTAGWTAATDPVLGPGSSIRPSELVEGPSMIRFNDEWLLYADAYTAGHYSMISSPNFVNWSDETPSLSFPVSHPLHGTAVVVDSVNVGWHLGPRADLTDDGLIDPADWMKFRANHITDISVYGPLERALRGDLDGDGDNDFFDFRLFKTDYIAANGAAAFAALQNVPEPPAMLLAVLATTAALITGHTTRKRRVRRHAALNGAI